MTMSPRRMIPLALASCLLVAAIASPAFSAAGVLDSSFGVAGKLTTNLSSGFDAAFAVAVQADGAIVAAGKASGAGGKNSAGEQR